MAALITNIVFAFISIFALAVMLRQDVTMLQQKNFANKAYYEWLRETDEVASIKRILHIVILIAAVSSLGMQSWYVMAILAAAVLYMAVSSLRKKPSVKIDFTGRARSLYFATLVILVAIMALASIFGTAEEGVRNALYLGLFFTTFSFAFIIVVNWMFFKKTENVEENKDENKTN